MHGCVRGPACLVTACGKLLSSARLRARCVVSWKPAPVCFGPALLVMICVLSFRMPRGQWLLNVPLGLLLSEVLLRKLKDVSYWPGGAHWAHSRLAQELKPPGRRVAAR